MNLPVIFITHDDLSFTGNVRQLEKTFAIVAIVTMDLFPPQGTTGRLCVLPSPTANQDDLAIAECQVKTVAFSRSEPQIEMQISLWSGNHEYLFAKGR